jgi:thiol-disulfide isomerase/thioredoxin
VKYSLSFFLLVALIGCNPKKDENTISLSKVKLESLEGKPVDLTDYEGKIIFLNFWATWCRPCLLEMPSIEKAKNELKDENIVFLFASDEEVDQIENFKAARNFNFDYVRALNINELNIQALPTTFIFNAEGDLVFNEMGYRDWSKEENKKIIQTNSK